MHDGVAQLDNMPAIMILASGSGAISTDSNGARSPLLAISGIDARRLEIRRPGPACDKDIRRPGVRQAHAVTDA